MFWYLRDEKKKKFIFLFFNQNPIPNFKKLLLTSIPTGNSKLLILKLISKRELQELENSSSKTSETSKIKSIHWTGHPEFLLERQFKRATKSKRTRKN